MKDNIRNSNKKGFIAFVMIIIAVACFFGGYFIRDILKDPTVRTVEWVLESIVKNGYYIDEETGDLKKFTGEEIADSIVKNFLDDYSSYYTAKEYTDVLATNKGNNFGLGTTFLKATTDLEIFRVIGNSPADNAGLKKGDIITAVKIGDNRVDLSTREDLTALLTGVNAEEEFVLYALRNGVEMPFVVAKRVFTSSFVKYYDNKTVGKFITATDSQNKLEFITETSDEMNNLPDGTAYIKYDSFSGQSAFEMEKVMEYAKSQNATSIILDLRDNGGGQMDILTAVSSHFVKSDASKTPPIAFVRDAKGRLTHFSADDCKFIDDLQKIVVLANDNTASASECLIGAMLYYGASFSRDNLVIEKGDGKSGTTFGKGIMQTTYYNVITGEAIKLTTAKVFLPDRYESIHGKGFKTTDENSVLPKDALDRAIQIVNS